MNDLVERLRKFHAEIVESDGGECAQMTMTREAADEIERLQTEGVELKKRAGKYSAGCELCDPREAEIKRLQAKIVDLEEWERLWINKDEERDAVIERLRAGLRTIRGYYIPNDAPKEVWCGDESGDLPLSEYIDRLLADKDKDGTD